MESDKGPKKPLSLNRPGKLVMKKTVETGQVRQSFDHGRSKAVTVEVKRSRTFGPGAGGRWTEVTEARRAAEEALNKTLEDLPREAEKETPHQPAQRVIRDVTIPETITVQELANRMAEREADVIRTLMKMDIMVTINQTIDAETAELVVEEFGHKAKRVSAADVELGHKKKEQYVTTDKYEELLSFSESLVRVIDTSCHNLLKGISNLDLRKENKLQMGHALDEMLGTMVDFTKDTLLIANCHYELLGAMEGVPNDEKTNNSVIKAIQICLGNIKEHRAEGGSQLDEFENELTKFLKNVEDRKKREDSIVRDQKQAQGSIDVKKSYADLKDDYQWWLLLAHRVNKLQLARVYRLLRYLRRKKQHTLAVDLKWFLDDEMISLASTCAIIDFWGELIAKKRSAMLPLGYSIYKVEARRKALETRLEEHIKELTETKAHDADNPMYGNTYEGHSKAPNINEYYETIIAMLQALGTTVTPNDVEIAKNAPFKLDVDVERDFRELVSPVSQKGKNVVVCTMDKKASVKELNYATFSHAMFILTNVLQPYVYKVLRKELKDKWWEEGVIEKLKYKERQFYPKKGTDEQLISIMDARACLKAIRGNWGEIFQHKLGRPLFEYIGQLPDARDVWAHYSGLGFDTEGTQHSLYAMMRLAGAIDKGAGEHIEELRERLELYEKEIATWSWAKNE